MTVRRMDVRKGRVSLHFATSQREYPEKTECFQNINNIMSYYNSTFLLFLVINPRIGFQQL
jgi:hypothetical protein